MNVHTHLRHMHLDEGFENQVRIWVEQRFRKYGRAPDFSVNVYVSIPAPGSFECHMQVDSGWLPKTLFAKKIDEDFWTTMQDCADAVTHQLVKVRDVRQSKRRHHHDFAI